MMPCSSFVAWLYHGVATVNWFVQAQVKLRDKLVNEIEEMQIRKEKIATRVGEMTQKIVSITEDMGGSATVAAVR